MRAFIGIALPDAVRQPLQQAQRTLKAALDSSRDGHVDVRWTPPESIHLTLKFLGEVTDEQARELVKALKVPYRTFTAEVRGLGFFPDAKRPRVLWAGVEGAPELLALARSIESITRRSGFPSEDHPFTPHLTLARIRDSARGSALAAAVQAFRAQSFGEFEASAFSLFESRLAPGTPAEYRLLARFPGEP